MMPLLANVGYADLFCCFMEEPSNTEVSTLSDPMGGRLNWKLLLDDGSTGVATLPGLGEPLLFFNRARRDVEASLGSLLVLMERARPSGCEP